MDTGNKTSFKHCRFLGEDYFHELHSTFLEAYSDYFFPCDLTEAQFRNHLLLNGVDLNRTVGSIENGRLIGFSLNGFGKWNGVETAYDAGTGVIPLERRRGVSEQMFELMDNVFPSQGIGQMLLEVISQNIKAINLYEKLGFQKIRELALLECDGEPKCGNDDPQGIEYREIADPDWKCLDKMTVGRSSWQNSYDAIDRTRHLKTIIGAFNSDECVGFAILSAAVGRMSQITVRSDHSGRGIGSGFIRRMRKLADPSMPLQIVNAPKEIGSAVRFFERMGFREKLVQFEMLKVY